MQISLIPVYNFFGGRSTTFLLAFTITGITLAFRDHLTPIFVTFATSILGLVVGHSIKEDWFDSKKPTDKGCNSQS